MVQEACRGDRAHEVALLPSKHSGQHVACDIDVRHDVHIPDALPIRVACLRPATDSDACVGAKDVNASLCDLHLLDQLSHLCFTRHITSDRHASDFARHRPCSVSVHVGNNDDLRAR